MEINLQDLFRNPFRKRSFENQVGIIRSGPPRPSLKAYWTPSPVIPSADMVNIIQQEDLVYGHSPWVTACTYQKNFFCWPCILFDDEGWLRGKYTASNNLYSFLCNVRYHEMTSEHIQAEILLKVFSAQFVKPYLMNLEMEARQRAETLKKEKEALKMQRDVLKRLIDIVCHCLAKEQPLHKEGNFCQHMSVDCVNILQLLRKYDKHRVEEIEFAQRLLKRSPKIVDDLVNIMACVVNRTVRIEIKMAAWVTVILSKHFEVENISVISTVLRYAKDGQVFERFIGFNTIGCTKPAYDVLAHVKIILDKFGFSDKFLAYSLDGGIVARHSSPDLIELLKYNYPTAHFVPWYCHKLECILLQSLSYLKECKPFIKTVNSIAKHFNKKSDLFKSLHQFMLRKHHPLKNAWFKRSQIFQIINTYRLHFVEFLEFVQNSYKTWNGDDIAQAKGFHRFLQEFHSVFLFEVFSRIFSLLEPFRDLLKSNASEKIFDTRVIENYLNELRLQRDQGFNSIWIKVKKIAENSQIISKLKFEMSVLHNTVHYYCALFNEIINRTINEIQSRFYFLDNLEFCHMLINVPVDKYSPNQRLDIYISKLISAYGSYFKRETIKCELITLHAQLNSPNTPKMSIEDLYKTLHIYNWKVVYPHVYKVAELAVTLPNRHVSSHDSTSKYKNIEKWSSVLQSMTQPCDNGVSILCVEINFLQELKKTESFYDTVIHDFHKRHGTVELSAYDE